MAWANPEIIAYWSSAATTQYSNGGSGYNYTPTLNSGETRTDIKVAYSNQIYFYGFDKDNNVQTSCKLTAYSSNTSKKCGFYNQTEEAFWLGVDDNSITNYTIGSQHNNYLEVSFPATGYKNVTFHADVAGFSNNSGKVEIVASPDGGTTWFYGGEVTTGNHYNTFNVNINKELAVANCANVIVRLIVGNDAISRSDWRVKNISITGEALGATEVRSISVASDNSANGYVQVNPIGNKFSDGTEITVKANGIGNYRFSYWSDNNSERSSDNPYTFTASSSITSVTANMKTSTTLSEWTFATIDFTNASGKKQDYPADTYVDASHKGTFSVYTPSGKAEWKDISATNKEIVGTTTSLNLNGVRRAYKYWSDSGFDSPCYAQIEISTVGYANIQIKSYLESWTDQTYVTQKLQYSTDGTSFTDLASVDFTQTQRWHPLNGGGASAMANQATLYIRWTYDMTGSTLSGSALTGSNSEDVRIGGIVITGEPLRELNENSNYTVTPESDSYVHLTRGIKADNWSTIVLPFALTNAQLTSAFGTNVKVAELTNSDATTLNFNTVTSTVANQPYAIKVSSSDSYSGTATINGVTIVNDTPTQSVTNWDFVGTYSNGTITAGDYYFKDNQLRKATGTQTIKPFRAYLHYTGSGSTAPNFVIDGNVTGIAHISADGQMNLEEGAFYNMNGQRVAQPTKGLYIVNGKKVIIK